MKRFPRIMYLILTISCGYICGCQTVNQSSQIPAQFRPTGPADPYNIGPNSYWYKNDGGNDAASASRGTYYEYNDYLICFSSEPCKAVITWNVKEIGTASFKYRFSGKLFTDENLMITATPLDPKFTVRKARINLYGPLPRLIHFDFTKN
jgi:hypothetical protein